MLVPSVDAIVQDQDLLTLAPDATVRDAARAMAERRVGAVPVVAGDRLVGIFSERDLLQRVAATNRDPDATLLAEVMTEDLVLVDADATVARALSTMIDGGFRHLPVMRRNRLVGILSLRDIPTEYWVMRQNWMAHRTTPTIN